jgi:RimJ/RimL family protein N-acetyltransferase
MPETILTERLELVLLSPDLIEALLAFDLPRVRSLGGFEAPRGWPDEHDADFLRLRLSEIRGDPATARWFARGIVLPAGEERPLAGHIGFHGPPRDGTLELGYTVFEPWRRRGIATEAAGAMMDWGRREHAITRYRLSVSPDNAPSLAMAQRLGFVQTGEQWDDEDGLEYVFERTLG